MAPPLPVALDPRASRPLAGATVRRGELAAALRSPAQVLHWLTFASQMLHETFAPRFPHQNRPNSPRRRAPPCRPATALAHVALSLPAPRTRPRWITHATYSILGQSPLDSTPRQTNLASPVSHRRGSFCSGEQRRLPRAPSTSGVGSRSDGAHHPVPRSTRPDTGQYRHFF